MDSPSATDEKGKAVAGLFERNRQPLTFDPAPSSPENQHSSGLKVLKKLESKENEEAEYQSTMSPKSKRIKWSKNTQQKSASLQSITSTQDKEAEYQSTMSPKSKRIKWSKNTQQKSASLQSITSTQDKGHMEKAFKEIVERFSTWESFRKFAYSLYGLQLQLSDIDQISKNTDLVYKRKKLILEKWVGNRKYATAEILRDRIKTYDLRQGKNLYSCYLSNADDFSNFALSPHGLGLSKPDIQEIINDERTTEFEKSLQMLKKWETKKEKEITNTETVELIGRYIDTEFLKTIQKHLRNVKEFEKFALSQIGLCLSESDIEDIEDEDKINKIKKKWKQKFGITKDDSKSRYDDCMIRYCRADCINISLEKWGLWIPGMNEQHDRQENHPIYGGKFRGTSCAPIATWFVRKNTVNKCRLEKLDKLEKHKNVVPVAQVGCYRTDYFYIAMENQLTETLKEALQDQIDENLLIELCLQLLQGLNVLHENDIAHRNLTLQKIFVSKDKKSLQLSGYHAIFSTDDDVLDNIYQAPECVSNKTISKEMNIYTAGNIITKILTNGRYSFRQIHHEPTPNIPNINQPEFDSRYLLVSKNPFLRELLQQMCNPEPAMRLTALEALKKITFVAYNILSGQSQNQLVLPNVIIQCRRIAENFEDITYWGQDETEKLTQRDRPQCMITTNGDNDVKQVSISDIKVTEDDVPSLTTSDKEYIIEFCDCEISASFLKSFYEKMNPKCKISKLTLSYTDSITDLIEMICSIICKWGTKGLSLEYDNMNDKDVDLLQKYMTKNRIPQLKELNVSYNKDISPVGFRQIGELVHEFKIEALIAADCDFTEEKFEKFMEGLKDSKLEHFDISCNSRFTTKGFERLADLVGNRKVRSLNLSACDLTEEDVRDFCNNMSPKNSEQLLEELDVSHNPEITPSISIGPLIVKCGIKKLNLAACKLAKTDFVQMQESTTNHEMNTICVKDNFTLRDGVIEVAEFVKQCGLKTLDIVDCMLTASQLRAFRETLGTVKLQRLHLGDKKREPDAFYIEEISKLFWNVEDVMYLQFCKLSKASRELLWKQFVECSTILSVILSINEVTDEWKKFEASTISRSSSSELPE